MSFSSQFMGEPAAVAASLRAAGAKNSAGLAEQYGNAVRAAYDAAAVVSEAISGSDWRGSRGVVAQVNGHVGSDGNCNVTLSVAPYPVAGTAPTVS